MTDATREKLKAISLQLLSVEQELSLALDDDSTSAQEFETVSLIAGCLHGAAHTLDGMT